MRSSGWSLKLPCTTLPSRKVIFDIGISGPMVGFVASIGVTVAGAFLMVANPSSTELDVIMRQADALGTQFNEAVDRYNHAIAQFPALLVAWLFGFRSGRRL